MVNVDFCEDQIKKIKQIVCQKVGPTPWEPQHKSIYALNIKYCCMYRYFKCFINRYFNGIFSIYYKKYFNIT